MPKHMNLVTLPDLSGNASTEEFRMLKRSMQVVISSLGSTDYLSIVAFSDCSKRLFPLRRMTCHSQNDLAHQDEFVMHVGNLLSVVAQELKLALRSAPAKNSVVYSLSKSCTTFLASQFAVLDDFYAAEEEL
ncbi:hypothetical protein Fmac_017725 [Flemingia macrophylla]|uniref:VWFA domain-containing protein n=1 Tax=Flemingia macrophylla TaxID=520843 RepID=A0ABD1M2Z2_9FABA